MTLNLFDALKVLNDPKFLALADKIPEWISQWDRLVSGVRFLESAAQSADNRLVYLIRELESANEKLTLIMSETHISPDLHAEAVAMSRADPRNAMAPHEF